MYTTSTPTVVGRTEVPVGAQVIKPTETIWPSLAMSIRIASNAHLSRLHLIEYSIQDKNYSVILDMDDCIYFWERT